MLARIISGAFGASLVVDGLHALWRIGLRQGPFFAITSLLITVGGVALICSGTLSHEKAPPKRG